MPTTRKRLEFVLDVLILAGALATIPLTILLEEHRAGPAVVALDWAVWGVFAFEFIARLFTDRLRLARAGRHALALAVVVVSFPMLPDLLGLVRLARLTRVVRALRLATVVARGIGELRSMFVRRGVLYVGALSALLILAGGAGFALIEPHTARGGLADGVWWAIVTASTVGYGDIAPSTIAGRAIAVVMMLAGIGIISTLAGSVTAYFVGQAEDSDLADVRDRLSRIEERVDRLITIIENQVSARETVRKQ